MENVADILVICTANRGRSPFIEHLLRKLIDDEQLMVNVHIHSVGLCCYELGRSGKGADPKVVELGRKFGLDLNSHAARPMTPSIVENCDLVIVMEEWQVDVLIESLHLSVDKVVTLRQLGGSDRDITTPDIANASSSELDNFAAEAQHCLERGLQAGPLAEILVSRARG